MTPPLEQAQDAIRRAREALSRGDRRQARHWAETAAKLAPQLEDPWLVLAAVAGPRLGLEYIQRALQVNPESPRARRGMEWVLQRLRDSEPAREETQETPALRSGATLRAGRSIQTSPAQPGRKRLNPVVPAALLILGCMILGLAGWAAMSSPIAASLIARPVLASEPTQLPQWAPASIAKPTYTAAGPVADVLTSVTATPEVLETQPAEGSELSTPLSTELPTDSSTDSSGDLPSQGELPTAEPTWSGSLTMDYVEDTPTPEAPPYSPPTQAPAPDDTATGEHWIDVNLSQQMAYAYAGDTVVNSFLVSTGTWLTPTVTGKFRIWIKLRYSDMSGPDYYLPNVPYVMYFYKDYGLHGTYWHNNFGTPMSHGCVNFSIPDAAWVYDFVSEGSVVNVHY